MVDRKLKIYRCQEDLHGTRHLVSGRLSPSLMLRDTVFLPAVEKKADLEKPLLREQTEQALLQQTVLAGALVSDRGDILCLDPDGNLVARGQLPGRPVAVTRYRAGSRPGVLFGTSQGIVAAFTIPENTNQTD